MKHFARVIKKQYRPIHTDSCNAYRMVAENIGTDTLVVTLDSEWDDMDRVVVLFEAEDTYAVEYDSSGVPVPYQVLHDTAEMRVSLCGYVGDEKRLVTERMERPYTVVVNGAMLGDAVSPVTTDALEQAYVGALGVKEAAERGDFDGERGPQGPQGPKGDSGTVFVPAFPLGLADGELSIMPVTVRTPAAEELSIDMTLEQVQVVADCIEGGGAVKLCNPTLGGWVLTEDDVRLTENAPLECSVVNMDMAYGLVTAHLEYAGELFWVCTDSITANEINLNYGNIVYVHVPRSGWMVMPDEAGVNGFAVEM